MFSHLAPNSEMSDSDSICWAIKTKIRTRDHHIWWCGTALWACVLVGGMLAAQWAIGVPVLCTQWGLPWSEVKLAGRAGSIVNHNGLLLMVAARGQRSLLSAWGDFQQAHGVKLESACTPTHLNWREAPQGEWESWKAKETVFFPSHTHIDTIPSQNALRSVNVGVLQNAPSQVSFANYSAKYILIQHSRS